MLTAIYNGYCKLIEGVTMETKLIISKSGCYFFGYDLIHTDDCSCDDDYMESLE